MNIEIQNFPYFEWKDIYVTESNRIDPQPGYAGNIAGCRMYDNHMSALNYVLSEGWEINQNTPADIHRILTRGIPFFEDSGNSGFYRKVDCYVGIETCPYPYQLNNLMKIWFDTTKRLIDLAYDKKITSKDCAFISQHIFEVIHPFIDGNGRTGRLLINKVLNDLGAEPIIIMFDDRQKYYESIQSFRETYWTGKQFKFDF